MRPWAGLLFASLAISAIGSQNLSACGDKFLLVGRGVNFRRAYAAIHPASILLVLPARDVKSAAVRDSSLLSALKLAGHRVEVVQQPVNLADVLGRFRHDIVLAEKLDAAVATDAAASLSEARPSVVAVVEDRSPAAAQTVPQGEYVLKAPQSLAQILNLLDDVMKARLAEQRRIAAPGA